ncbi:Hsp20/alpha crystallin family protein [Flavitalea flava]
MDYNQSWAAKGRQDHYGHHGPYGRHGNRNQHLSTRSMQRASVNVYRTGTSYEMLVFAPGRIKEHFHLELKGKELTISYTPPEGFQRPEWIMREYSRGGFLRTFALDESVDSANITAKYVDGVLEVSLPLIAGQEGVQQEIPIS